MQALKQLLKKALQRPADALLASSRSLPGHIEECLDHSASLANRVEACLANSPGVRTLIEHSVRNVISGREPQERPAGSGLNGTSLPTLADLEAEILSLPYQSYLEQAQAAKMDINDFLELSLGWSPVDHLLERSLVPLLKPDSVVIELGAGTGRWSVEILRSIPDGQLHLVDYCDWFVKFQRDYFKDDARVSVHRTNGFSLPMESDNWADICCSYGTFLVLKVGNTWRYAQEFFRVLKPGGQFLIEYLDIETPEGWQWMVDQSKGEESAGCFVYYTPAIIKRLFEDAGLEVLRDEHVAKWYNGYHARWLYGRKPA